MQDAATAEEPKSAEKESVAGQPNAAGEDVKQLAGGLKLYGAVPAVDVQPEAGKNHQAGKKLDPVSAMQRVSASIQERQKAAAEAKAKEEQKRKKAEEKGEKEEQKRKKAEQKGEKEAKEPKKAEQKGKKGKKRKAEPAADEEEQPDDKDGELPAAAAPTSPGKPASKGDKPSTALRQAMLSAEPNVRRTFHERWGCTKCAWKKCTPSCWKSRGMAVP